MSGKKTRIVPRTNFGAYLDEQIHHGRTSTGELAGHLQRSESYISQIKTGLKNAGPKAVDKIADALGAPDEERARMHLAAAKDAGFKIRLPDGF